tara:strand:- start:17760 stop:18953 length:1194 start_codon:yes stop_codon:yes gene_type:complete
MAAWDWSEFTSGYAGLSLLGRSIRDSISHDALEGKDDFVAVALTDLFPLSAEQMMGIDAASTSVTSRGNPRYGFHGRALGPQSPVSWLPDPCDPARAGSSPEQKATNWWLIKAHTLFYTTGRDDSFNITRGDKVHVKFDHLADPPYRYNVKYGKIVAVAAHENPDDSGGVCSSLIDLFGNIARGAVPIGAGASTGTGPVIPATDRDAAITQFYGVLQNIQGWPAWATISSRGRTIQEGRQMIYNFADQLKTGTTKGDSRLDNNGDLNDAAEVERLRLILTANRAAGGYGKAIARPESSNHCAGAGCVNQTVIAFDISAPSVAKQQEIGDLLRSFFNDTTTMTGMQLNLSNMFGGFNDGSFVAGMGSGVGRPGQGYYGWREEPNNGAVHIEFKYPGTP